MRNRRLTNFQARLVACTRWFCYAETTETYCAYGQTNNKHSDSVQEEKQMILADKIIEDE